MTDQTNALLYLRTARANDDDIAEQRHRCATLAEARGWRVVDVIFDNGVSGTGDEPGLTILRDRIVNGEAQAVIATDLTRISRDPEAFRAFARFCEQNDADLSFVDSPDNLGSLDALTDDDRASDLDSDRKSGLQPVEFRL
ncbi:hypothetical protein PARPLA_00889 [Rhodobacteraceae bacterium THAF1]|uniref:recombinase family protein n=1 Tax=Palleronia sp. THAF1 TaxID=2587842 RepID=UPI000F3AAA6F|nr:recombinase family protein [Palleronia sp. THAF1]QFU07167.1 hypothetical protein FIU81_00580 [Palleronia sp. THAF1]VDC20001.1 hypothetical protein PARPLA_00889 [Rhodobacteraceae bacterium THAF1]